MSTSDSIVTQYAELRREMAEQIARHAQRAARETGKLVLSEHVMEVMKAVPRHAFVTSMRSDRRPTGYCNSSPPKITDAMKVDVPRMLKPRPRAKTGARL